MASIVKRQTSKGDTHYLVRYRDPSGKVRNKTFRRAEDARRFASTTEADMVRGAWVDPNAGRVLFRDYAARWVAERTTSRGRKLAPRTVELYRSQLAKHIEPTFGDVDLSKITVAAVRSWHSQLVGRGHPTAAAKCYRLLRAILATAVEDDLILKNPCTIKGAGVERSGERPVATADQVWDLADEIDDHLRAFILVGAFAGLRFSEAAGLQRRHVDLLHRTITVEHQLERVSKATAEHLGMDTVGFGPPKSDAGYRTLAIPAPLVPELERHLGIYAAPGPDGLVFVGPLGAPLSRGNFTHQWKPARIAAGLPAGFRYHDLRHTHMTAAAESGASTKELMRRLGQSSPAAALRYQHATDRRDVEIADAVGATLRRRSDDRRAGQGA
ncbi:site-specific integrase [Dermatobacter hominis]|uniref:site-specific integrase n=1 Tax=Dermatobacter hominis TaxID=2884263 RepID=UPI001D12984C|nr:site-specific integrase [Dermatobacter hominis]UDY35697.1 site-specific integrase [Dermatobacter hominis]